MLLTRETFDLIDWVVTEVCALNMSLELTC